MLTKKKKPSKLLFVLGEYFVFSVICGFISVLFFHWASGVITANYMFATGIQMDESTESWIAMVIIVAGVVIFASILMILVQRKFSYILEINNSIEEMEAGNLQKIITIEGDDEITDLAISINNLVGAIDKEFKLSEQMKQERLQTIATLSHDIRTPLTSVMSYLQFIRDGQYKDTQQLKLYAEKAYYKAIRIKDMTDSLFESCVLNEEHNVTLERVNGANFLNQTFFEASEFLMESGFIVDVKSSMENTDFCIMIDRDKLTRVFDNIFSNIEKYADKNYPIMLRAEIRDDYIVFMQKNTVINKNQKRNIESHLIGLKSVKDAVSSIGGLLNITEENNVFILEIKVPIC